jgi:hypothetical protein
MESTLNFITKFTNVVKDHLSETKECIGKEVIDTTATKTGICVDRVKHSFGAKFSLLGHKYSQEEIKQIEAFNEDVLVCQSGNNHRFFVPVSSLLAVGESAILVGSTLNLPEIRNVKQKREEVFRKYFLTKESIRELLPKVEQKIIRKKKKRLSISLFH